MLKRQKELLEYQLSEEEKTIAALEKHYRQALHSINEKIRLYQADEQTVSRVHHINFQKQLKRQIEAELDKLHSNEYTTIQQYLDDAYTDGFVGTMYDLAGQGVPVIAPIDKNAAVKAILTDSQISEDLYTTLGVDTKKLKQAIRSEITRGIASGMLYSDIARNIATVTGSPLNRAKTIVRTEGHRIQEASRNDARMAAKAKGAETVKQWESTLDGETRPTHRQLDGQIRDVDKPFTADGKEAMYPGDFGDPAEDCNCRCMALTRARKALMNPDELQRMQERAAFFELDKTQGFADFKTKYIHASEKTPKETAKESQAEQPVRELSDIEAENQRGKNAVLESYSQRIDETSVRLISPEELAKQNIVDYKNADPRAAAAANEVLEKYQGQYNSWLTGVDVTNSLPYGAGGYTEISAVGGSGNITLNGKMLKDYDTMVDAIRQNGISGFGIKVKDGYYDQYIMTHEYGHTLLQQAMTEKSMVGIDNTTYKKAMKEAKKIYSDYKKEYHDLKDLITTLRKEQDEIDNLFWAEDADPLALMKRAKKVVDDLKQAEEDFSFVAISDYANGDIDEFIAEAWTDREIGENPSKYSIQVGKLIDKYFGY